jgi:uncharacterized protein
VSIRGSICYHGDSVAALPFLTHSAYLLRTYGTRVYRLAVDGGFSCPNRGDRSSAGCTYCGETGARAPYQAAGGLAEQVRRGAAFLGRRYGASSFILYFQAYSGTNAPAGELRRIYDEALSAAPFRELAVSTRPDCVDAEKAELLASYRGRGLDVWVELGLQSAHDRTLRLVNRGHTVADFEAAYRLLKRSGTKVAVHVVFGLPGEGEAETEETARYVASLEPDGVKIHNLHIPRGTSLAVEYLKGEVTAPGPQWHMEQVIRALELLPERTVVMRLTCDTPPGELLAPRGFWDKRGFTERLAAEMRARGARQGRLCEPSGVRPVLLDPRPGLG